MSLPGGELYTSSDNAANIARQNIKGVHQLTGDQIIALLASADSKKGMILSCILDSTDTPPAQYKKGIVYRVNPDNVTIADPMNESVGHNHSGTAEGGPMLDVILEGMKNVWYARPISMTKEQFYQTQSGGTFTNKDASNDQYIEISAATTNNYGNLHLTNGFYSFGYAMRVNMDIKLTNNLASYTARAGLNAEPSQNTTDDFPKVIIEACPGCNGNNVRIITATGASGSRSNNPKNSSDVANVRDKYLLQFYPGVRVDYVSTTGLLQKTLDIPDLTSGNSTPLRNFLAGIQTTTTSARIMELFGLEAVARKADSSFRNNV